MKTKKHILVINDEPALLEQLQRLLLGSGYTVTTTLYGNEGFELIRNCDFDLILLDYYLDKEKDGQKTALSYIHKIKKINSTIPIILMSANAINLSPESLGVSDVILVNSSFWGNISNLIRKNLVS